jgi:hypothetical protein
VLIRLEEIGMCACLSKTSAVRSQYRIGMSGVYSKLLASAVIPATFRGCLPNPLLEAPTSAIFGIEGHSKRGGEAIGRLRRGRLAGSGCLSVQGAC